MSFFYQSMANLIAIVHLGYVSFVVLGQLLILVGLLCKWKWIRNLWFRSLHLLAIVIVVVEALAGIPCPLTVWENQLRELAGQTTNREDFIASFVHRVMFFELEPWVFTAAYCSFGLAVAVTFIAAPPRFRRAAPNVV